MDNEAAKVGMAEVGPAKVGAAKDRVAKREDGQGREKSQPAKEVGEGLMVIGRATVGDGAASPQGKQGCNSQG